MPASPPLIFPIPESEIPGLVSSAPGIERVTAVEPLAGDASTRRFYRIRLVSGGSLVAMALDGPIDPAVHPQVVVGRYLESVGIPVPHLAGLLARAGLLLYEDLGDLLLQDVATSKGASSGSSDTVDRLYLEAVQIIARLQGNGTRRLPADHPSARTALDSDRFLFELRFFRQHYVEGLRELRFGPRESAALERFFESLAGEASAPPRVLCHRDFHSRNLLVQGTRIRTVDFQDARLGPQAYDLASLLRDSYVVLPSGLTERLLKAFLEACRSSIPDPDAFTRQFDVVSIQRNLKAIGTFAYQAVVAGKSHYLPYIEPTWEHIFGTLDRVSRWSEIKPILEAAAGR